MSLITVGKENSTSIDLYYEDLGVGQPVVLIHGWPLSGHSWERQVAALLAAGHRVVTYDRRGFGQSSQSSTRYDYDTFAADLDALLNELDLNDVVLVGFSMGGGEVARYLGKYGSKRVSKAVFMGAITPALRKDPDNPQGVDGGVFDGIQQELKADRPAFLAKFFQDFYNVDVLGGKKMSVEALDMSWNVAVAASPVATIECVTAWGTDFRADLKKVDIPVLVVHGDADRIVPLAVSGARMQEAVANSRLVVIPGAPHGFTWTHGDEANRELLGFIGQEAGATRL
ncbi:MAG: alpha/beta hydrolase [Candidatus Eisenbacteria bacterium]